MMDSTNYVSNYYLPYRGIPAEVRLSIWDYAVPEIISLHFGKSFPHVLKPSNEAATYLNLLLVSKEVREEVFAATDRKIIFDIQIMRLNYMQTAWKALSPGMVRMIKAVEIPLYNCTSATDPWQARVNDSVARAATLSHVSELHVYINGNIWLKNATLAYEQRSGGKPTINATGFIAGYGCKIEDQSHKIQKALFKSSAPLFHGFPITPWPFALLWDLLGAVAQNHVSIVRIRGDHLNRFQCALLQEEFESFLQIYHSQHLKKDLVHMNINFPGQESMLDGSNNEGEMVIQRI